MTRAVAGRFWRGGFWSDDGPSAPTLGPITSAAPSVSPAGATVGVAYTRTQGVYAPRGGGVVTVTREWVRGATQVAGDVASYTPVGGDIGAVLFYRETAVETGGTAAGTVVQIATLGTVQPVAATAPAAFTAGQWSLADAGTGGALTLNITALPGDGGSAITALQVSVNAGVYTTLSGTGTGARTITGLVNGTVASVKIRAVNAIDAGADSDTKTATPSAGGTTDPNLLAVSVDGWRGTHNAPAGTLGDVIVLRPGFDASGAATTVTETVKITGRVRQPSPNEGSNSTNEVAFSDKIYFGDQVIGFTNSSTETYEQPIGCWLDPEWERITASTYGPRLCVFHRYARNNRPVAAVVFTATDGVTTLTQTVTTMQTVTYSVSGLTACFFQPSFDMTALAQGPVTFGAEIRPWCGAAFNIPARTESFVTANWRQRKALNDRGSYGTAIAYVTVGAGGTPQVSTTEATAAANPYATVAAAAAAIQTFNNANFGRNNASGGVIKMNEGAHTHNTFSSVAIGEIPLIVTAAPGAVRANITYTDQGVNQANTLPDKIEFNGITLRKSGTHGFTSFGMSAGQTLDFMMTLRDVAINGNGAAANAAWITGVGNLYIINCTGDAMSIGFQSAATNKYSTIIGCDASFGSNTAYACVASRSCALPTSTTIPREGLFIYNCRRKATSDAATVSFSEFDATVGAAGIAVIGTLLDRNATGTTTPQMTISADSVVGSADNIQVHFCSILGSRTNLAYNDSGTAFVRKNAFLSYCILYEDNHKTDTFPTANGARTGNWQIRYRCGSPGNTILRGDSAGGGYGPGQNLGERAGIGELSGTQSVPLATAFVDNQQNAVGEGDYRPAAGTVISLIPAGKAPYPVDLFGRPYPNDGTGVAGACQRAA